MSNTTLTINRVRKLLSTATKRRVVVVGEHLLIPMEPLFTQIHHHLTWSMVHLHIAILGQ